MESRALHLEGAELLPLDQPGRLIWVAHGTAMVFAAPVLADGTHGPRRWLAEVPAGGLIPGFLPPRPPPAHAAFVSALGSADLSLLEGPRVQAWYAGSERENALRVEEWLLALPKPGALSPPQAADDARVCLAAPGRLRMSKGQVCVNGRAVLWFKVLSGHARWWGSQPIQATDERWLPLAPEAWVEAVDDCTLDVRRTGDLEHLDSLLHGLALHNSLLLDSLAEEEAREGDRWRARLRTSQADTSRRAAHLMDTFARIPRGQPVEELPYGSPWWASATLVAKATGIVLEPLGSWSEAETVEETVTSLSDATRIRTRRVRLEPGWWKKDGGPLLVVRRDGNAPAAALPIAGGGYRLVDPSGQSLGRVTRAVAERLHESAYAFVRPLPARIRHAGDLLGPALQPQVRQLGLVVLAGLAVAVLNMLTPQCLGLLVDYAVPQANRTMLFEMSAGLLAAALSAFFLRLTENAALLRIEMGLEATLQLALWDRLLRLETGFFRRFSAGDLYDRASIVSSAHRLLGGELLRGGFNSLLSLVFLLLMFVYSAELAWPAALMGLAIASVTFALGFLALKRRRVLLEMQGRLRGLTVQLLASVAKLRVAGAEGRAFGRWAVEQARWGERLYGLFRLENVAEVLHVILLPLGTLVIFALAADLLARPEPARLTTGAFLAFWAAYGAFAAGLSGLAETLLALLDLPALWARAQPILEAPLEVAARRADPGRLKGQVDIQDLVFRYRADGPLVIDRLSLHAEPGEFVALVGPSGCGKSTLIRLLLGFETPSSGAVYYDRQDLQGLDLDAVRRQLGVVLQSAHIFAGTLRENLSPGSWISEEEALEAAEKAGLEEDLKTLPMGLFTLVSEGGTNLSGGQRQRLLLARALIRRPRVLLLDEATSALDNRTQEIVARNLETMNVTRIVVAHRLSTIRRAHRIYVMESGRIVQTGTYDELVSGQGRFRRLVGGQLD